MRRLELAMSVLSLAVLTAPTWPGAPRDLSHHLAEWHMPPVPTPRCGASVLVVAVLADPTHVDDRQGETVWLRNLEPDPIELVGWSLTAGRSRRPLDDVLLDAGERRALVGDELRPVRLPNRGGEVVLHDACGGATTLAWPDSDPGHVESRRGDAPDAPDE